MDLENPYTRDFGPFEGRTWLNTAHQGPLPKVAADAARIVLEEKIRPHLLRDEDFFDVPRRLRAALAQLITAAPDDIILGNSTTYGLDLLANGIRWQAGDEVLLVEGDFPANVLSWLFLANQGVSVRFIKARRHGIDPNELARTLSPRTRLFCTSWVNSFKGYAIDVKTVGQVCKENHVQFVLNASQGLGARVLDVAAAQVDAVTCSGSKWLCGPYGTGFCWLTPALRETLLPRHAYWLTMQLGKSLDKMLEYTLRTDLGARAWDVFCTANFLNYVPWTAAVEYLLRAGLATVSRYDEQLVTELLSGIDRDRFDLVSPDAGPERSTLVVLRPRGKEDGRFWQARLHEAGFEVAAREGNLRISLHLHNSQEDVLSLIKALGT